MKTHSLKRAARMILVGAPGVGKGTQSERLIQRYPQLSAISSGDLLRAAVRNKTPLGLEVEKTIESGALVPDATILSLILSEMRSKNWLSTSAASPNAIGVPQEKPNSFPNPTTHTPQPTTVSNSPTASFILDGFPRTAFQAQKLNEMIPINFVVSLVTPVDVILQRIAGRWVHAPSGRVYNTGFNAPKVPGKDDVTGEPLIQREDDSEATWRARLKKFEETSRPLLEYYDKKGLLWTVSGNSSDEISPKLYGEIERRFC
jgi:adenylate kinase